LDVRALRSSLIRFLLMSPSDSPMREAERYSTMLLPALLVAGKYASKSSMNPNVGDSYSTCR